MAAIYYILNLREQTLNRRVTSTNSLLQSYSSKEDFRLQEDLYNMKWSDFDDFARALRRFISAPDSFSFN